MLEIKEEDEINFEKIFGKDKINGYINKRGKHIAGWKEKYSIYKNPDVQAWLRDKIDQYINEGKEANKFSITSYLKSLQQYCQFHQTDNPSELLKEDINTRNRRFKKYVKFLRNAKDGDPKLKELNFRNGKSPSDESIRNNLQGRIKSFYSNRDAKITYKLKSVKVGANANELVLDRNYIKLIQAKLEAVNYRLICKFESQTGLRINDVLDEITSGKYKIEKHKERYFIRNFKTQKEMVNINYLFFTQELTELIQSATGEMDLTKLDLTKLFITRHGNTISANNYLERLKIIVKELGIKGNIKTHGLRKYFTSTLSKNRKKLEDDRIILHWEGREAPYRDQVYLTHIQDINFYYKEWKKIEPDICIDCIIVDKTSKKIKNVEAKYDELIKENIEKDKQITKLEEKLKAQGTTFKNMKALFDIQTETTNKEMSILKDKMSSLDVIMTDEIFTAIKREFMKKKEE